jgi:hypothetical protein
MSTVVLLSTSLFVLVPQIPKLNKLSAPLVFLLMYWMLAKAIGIVLTKADLLVPLTLFVILDRVPLNQVYKVLFFVLIFMALRKFFPQFY